MGEGSLWTSRKVLVPRDSCSVASSWRVGMSNSLMFPVKSAQTSHSAFGEMAVIDGLPRSATARVAEDAELISLKKSDFEKLCGEQPGLALKMVMNIVRVFSKRIREANEEYREMLIWSLQSQDKG